MRTNSMAKDRNIVHEYYSKTFDDHKLIIKVNPITFAGAELMVANDGRVELRELEFDPEIFEDLQADGFERSNPLEFNLIINGLAG